MNLTTILDFFYKNKKFLNNILFVITNIYIIYFLLINTSNIFKVFIKTNITFEGVSLVLYLSALSLFSLYILFKKFDYRLVVVLIILLHLFY